MEMTPEFTLDNVKYRQMTYQPDFIIKRPTSSSNGGFSTCDIATFFIEIKGFKRDDDGIKEKLFAYMCSQKGHHYEVTKMVNGEPMLYADAEKIKTDNAKAIEAHIEELIVRSLCNDGLSAFDAVVSLKTLKELKITAYRRRKFRIFKNALKDLADAKGRDDYVDFVKAQMRLRYIGEEEFQGRELFDVKITKADMALYKRMHKKAQA